MSNLNDESALVELNDDVIDNEYPDSHIRGLSLLDSESERELSEGDILVLDPSDSDYLSDRSVCISDSISNFAELTAEEEFSAFLEWMSDPWGAFTFDVMDYV